MVAVTVVPVEVAAGFGFESVQFVPSGAPSIAQTRATLPVNPFRPFTETVFVMLVPTLVEIAPAAVRVKSFTESVTFVERVMPSGALSPEIVTIVFTGRAVPKSVDNVTTDWFSGVIPGMTTAGFAKQWTPAGKMLLQLTAMSSVMPPSAV